MLVVLSIFLQMETSKVQKDPKKNRENHVSSLVKHGECFKRLNLKVCFFS